MENYYRTVNLSREIKSKIIKMKRDIMKLNVASSKKLRINDFLLLIFFISQRIV